MLSNSNINKYSMRELIDTLNDATIAYDKGEPIMTDKEWDEKYFILKEMEEISGTCYPDSPTQKIVFSEVSELKKVKHSHPMLSLDKTKDLNDIKKFFGDSQWAATAKLDGLTCSLTYKGGKLVAAETRGDGLIGEDVLNNVKLMKSVPCTVNYLDDLIIDGEVIAFYGNFYNWNTNHPNQTYKNPRNYAAGSLRLLNSKEFIERKLTFIAWDLIKGPECETLEDKLLWMEKIGFFVTPWPVFVPSDFEDAINQIKDMSKNKCPIDGIVFKFNNCQEYESKGRTDHHFKGGIAYKFYDETYETELQDIEWTMSRNSILTPVAIFNPVEIDGTTVSRATLHNLGVMESTLNSKYGWKNQKVYVAKMNMIIPKIIEAEETIPEDAKFFNLPESCPCCGGPVSVKKIENTYNLICENPNCGGRLINKLDFFCGKKGLDIKGLSKATLEKLIDWGWLENFSDIFNLRFHMIEWQKKSGFGKKSVMNILNNIAEVESNGIPFDKFITSIGIPQIGKVAVSDLIKFTNNYTDFRNKVKNKFDFSVIPNFGQIMSDILINFDYSEADKVAEIIKIKDAVVSSNNKTPFSNKIFVITGKLNSFKNRDELTNFIAARGGHVTSTVSKNTSYLVANVEEDTAKYKKAVELNIPIINESFFTEYI